MPTISVILTSFNHEKYLKESIGSVLNQTYSDYELIILDDASTDGSWGVIQEYDDPRIIAMRSRARGEITTQINKVIAEIASGEFICIHHSDDVWESTKLERQISYINRNPHVAAVFTNAQAISDDGELLSDQTHFYSNVFNQPNRSRHEWLHRFLNHGNALCHPSVLIRKSAYLECGLYKLHLLQTDDFDMWVRLLLRYDIHVLPERLVRFRVRDNEANVSGDRRDSRIRSVYEYYILLKNYREIRNFRDLVKIFPSAEDYDRGAGTDVQFALAMTILNESTHEFGRLFALDLLSEMISDQIHAGELKRVYGFDIIDFFTLTGQYDIFSREALAGRDSHINELNVSMSGLGIQVESQRTEIAAYAQQAIGMRASLTKMEQELVQAYGQIETQCAELNAYAQQAAEMLDALAAKDHELAEVYDRIEVQRAELVAYTQHATSMRDSLAENERELTKIYSQIEAQRAELSAYATQAAALVELTETQDAKIVRLNQELLRQESDLDRFRNTAIEQSKLIAEASIRIEQQGIRIVTLKSESDDRADAIRALINSRSWRVTQPLRYIGRFLRRSQIQISRQSAERQQVGDGGRRSLEGDLASLNRSSTSDRNVVVSDLGETLTAEQPPVIYTQAVQDGSFGCSEFHQFDEDFYLNSYPDVLDAGIDPYQHFIQYGRAEGRLPCAPGPGAFEDTDVPIMVSPAESPAIPTQQFPINAYQQEREPRADSSGPHEFDEEFYLETYPDVRDAGIDPYEHFIQYGCSEGRLGSPPSLKLVQGGMTADLSRDTILIVSHEASRTGAPVLALNLVIELQKKYNVLCLLLGSGPLLDDFRESACGLLGPLDLRGMQALAVRLVTDLCREHPLKFAIVNSIESRVSLEGLIRSGVPTLSLVHEFAAYTRPREAFPELMQWSVKPVFSTEITLDDARSRFSEISWDAVAVLPQGRSHTNHVQVDPLETEREQGLIAAHFAGRGGRQKYVNVIGLGSVHYRKGVDLFLECASHVLRNTGGQQCRFYWIGNGYDPVRDITYSSYLAEQVSRSGLEGKFRFIRETTALDCVYANADILLLSSRLDPLPNVAIDAMEHALPVVCFDRATGVAEILKENDLSDVCVAPYHDTSVMADRILKLAESEDLRRSVGERLQADCRTRFDMATYVDHLDKLGEHAMYLFDLEGVATSIIMTSGLMREDFFMRDRGRYVTTEDAVRFGYVRAWASGVNRRKLFPGFNPEIYRMMRVDCRESGLDPLAHYLRADQPDGPWKFRVISPNDERNMISGEIRTALHIHVYYPELFEDMLGRLCRNLIRPELFVSTANEEISRFVRATAESHEINLAAVQVVPNVGRDLAPLLTGFGDQLVNNYDIIGHVHTKKSRDVSDESMGKRWNEFLLENILGGREAMIDTIIEHMARNESIGIVFPDDPHIVGWGMNRPYAEKLCPELGIEVLPEAFEFPVGSMFWLRSEVLRPLINLGLTWADYPKEPLGYDGSILHAMERLFPLIARSLSLDLALTNVRGVTR